MRRRAHVTYSMLLLTGASIRCADVETGYVFAGEVPADLDALYRQIGQSNSCLNRFPRGAFRCELFQYLPCNLTVPIAEPVASSIPGSCQQYYQWFTGRQTEPVEWCLIGPNIEPSAAPGVGEEEWCAGISWMEAEFHSGSCDDQTSLLNDFQG